MIILALAIAFWINYAVSRWPNQDPDNNLAWQLGLGIQLIPGFFLFVLIWCKKPSRTFADVQGGRLTYLWDSCYRNSPRPHF
jgi:hypothetical protein